MSTTGTRDVTIPTT